MKNFVLFCWFERNGLADPFKKLINVYLHRVPLNGISIFKINSAVFETKSTKGKNQLTYTQTFYKFGLIRLETSKQHKVSKSDFQAKSYTFLSRS